MRRIHVCLLLLLTALSGLLLPRAGAVVPNQLQTAGLRSVANQGSFPAALFLSDGTIVLLWDQGDGIRVLHTDSNLTTVLSELHLGATGDHASELAPDGNGGVFVGGTSASGSLQGTAGAAFTSPTDASLNPFVAHLDQALQLSFLTFLGTGRSSLTAIGAGGGQVTITGVNYSGALPVTAGVLQSQPAASSAGTGYVASFSAADGRLTYATYLSGPDGNTTPATVAVAADGSAIIAGSTGSPGFPVVNALQPRIAGTSSGFLAHLSPEGARLLFSTYIAGAGLQSVALDGVRQQIVATGDLSFSSFPIANAAEPLANTPYQGLLRLSMDGTSLQDARVLLPGSASRVSTGTDGTAWITGQLSFSPTQQEIDAGTGDHYLLHLDLGGNVDTLVRFGGSAANHADIASLQTIAGAPAVSSAGDHVLVPASVTAATSQAFAGAQRFFFPLTPPTGNVLPATVNNLLPLNCNSGTCTGSAGLLVLLQEPSNAHTLALDTASSGLVTLHNTSFTQLAQLSIQGSTGSAITSCLSTLQPAAMCSAALPTSGGGLEISADALQSIQIAANPDQAFPDTPATDIGELNFGLVSAASEPARIALHLTNLGQVQEAFTATALNLPTGAAYTLTTDQGTCQMANAFQLPSGQSCSLGATVAMPAARLGDDSLLNANLRLGGRDIPVTGFLQAAAESVSSSRIDFGSVPANSAGPLPRFLYISNASEGALVHTPLQTSTGSPFDVEDDCPALLQPASACPITILYQPAHEASVDNLTLNVDGNAVLVTGETNGTSSTSDLPETAALVASPLQVAFSQPVLAATVSQTPQIVQLRNASGADLALQLQVLGEFVLNNGCPSMLAAQSSCSVVVGFAPSQSGQRTGVLLATDPDGTELIRVPLSGTGIELADLTSDVALGETTVGEPLQIWYHVSSSSVPLTATMAGTGWSVALAPDFGGVAPTPAPGTFRSAAELRCVQCWVGVRFLPSAAGVSQGTLTLSADAQGRPYQVYLHAAAMAQHGLLLTPMTSVTPVTPAGSSSEPAVLTFVNALTSSQTVSLFELSLGSGLQQAADHNSFDCRGLLHPGEACSIRIASAPAATGSSVSAIRMHTDQGDVTTSLSVRGAAPAVLRANPGALRFTTAGTIPVQLTNGGSQTISIQSITTTDTAFQSTSSCTLLQPGQTCTVQVNYTPALQEAEDLLTISYAAPDLAGAPSVATLQVSLSGVSSAGAALAAFPASIDFGPGSLGTPGETRFIRFLNQLATPVALTFAASHDFPLVTTPSCASVPPGGMCTVPVLFLPQAAGLLTGTLVASATASDGSSLGAASVTLRGYAAGSGGLVPQGGATADDPADFGTVLSGGTQVRSIPVGNTGSNSVSITGFTTAAPFHIVSSTCVGVLAPAAVCVVTVQYAPSLLLEQSQDASQAPRQDRATLLIENTSAQELLPMYVQGTVNPTAVQTPDNALPALVLDRSALIFGTKGQQGSQVQLIRLTNTGAQDVTVPQMIATGDFLVDSDCQLIQAGQSCALSVRFQPGTATPGLNAGSLLIASNAARALERITLLGAVTSGIVQSDVSTLAFGDVAVGSTKQQSVTLTNPDPIPSPLTYSISGAPYTFTGGTCPQTGDLLNAGQSCILQITFAPTSAGPQQGIFTPNTPAADSASQVTLTGTGIGGELQVNATLVNFGVVTVGSTKSLSLHLQNTGLAALSLMSPTLQGSDAAQFTVEPCSLSTLAPEGGCNMLLHFTPTQAGAASSTLMLAGGEGQAAVVVTLQGIGQEQPGIMLTVDGGTSSAHTVSSGSAAAFALLVTPSGGYTGAVTLTCTAMQPAPQAKCALAPATMSLQSGAAQGAVTISTMSGYATSIVLPFGAILLGWSSRRKTRLGPFSALALLLWLAGCSDRPVGAPYTPPGTYRYRVDAVATANPALHSSVLLNVSVE